MTISSDSARHVFDSKEDMSELLCPSVKGGGQIIEMTTLTWMDPHGRLAIDGTGEKFDHRTYCI